LTGDPDADADIMAFVQARQKLAQRGSSLSFSGSLHYILSSSVTV